VTPSQVDVRGELDNLARLLGRLLERKVQLSRSQLAALAARPVLARPEQQLRDTARRLDEWEVRLNQSLQGQLKQAGQLMRGLAGRLDALSPLAVLGRGYSLTERLSDDMLLRASQQVSLGELIRTRLAVGTLISQVREVVPDRSLARLSAEQET
jgi:exodeoxyribonuclease VII large subunit